MSPPKPEKPANGDGEEERQIRERVAPPGEIVYEAIYREGEHELDRSNRALAWSGLAAGLSMGFSFVAEALLRVHLPDAPWTPLIAKFGYAIGFLIVFLGRQQLFTKNTLTVILPLLNRRDRTRLRDVARLWLIVLLTNLAGGFLFALFLSHTRAFEADARVAFERIAVDLPEGFTLVVLRSLLAGWLIALMTWLLPFAETARVWVITLLAYVVGLGHFPHIVAGSVPAFYGVLTGLRTWSDCIGGFLLPTILGNVIGGVTIVAALAHAELSPSAASAQPEKRPAGSQRRQSPPPT